MGGGEGVVNHLRLLCLVLCREPGGRCGSNRPARVSGHPPQCVEEPLVHHRPGAHVAWLFLAPDDFYIAAVFGDLGLNLCRRERVELFETTRRCHSARLLSRLAQLVADLAGAEDDAPHLVGSNFVVGLAQHTRKLPRREVASGYTFGMPQQ